MLLPSTIDFDGPFPRLSRRLRLGVVGGGRISGMQATAARMTDRWEVVAGALSSDPDRAKAAAADWHLPEERCYISFAKMAEAMGARGIRIEHPDEFADAYGEAIRSGVPTVLDVVINRDTGITVTGTWQMPPIPEVQPTFGQRRIR